MMVSSVLEFTVATDWMAPTDKFNSIFWLMPLISVLGMLAWISFGFSLARIARCVVPRIRAQVL